MTSRIGFSKLTLAIAEADDCDPMTAAGHIPLRLEPDAVAWRSFQHCGTPRTSAASVSACSGVWARVAFGFGSDHCSRREDLAPIDVSGSECQCAYVGRRGGEDPV